ncbi:sigma-70 family RNA polymerase sigma factor [Gloeobacter violaceus]|uniref:Glr0220 protein n=1 Tax=Gloeobacter violaceus (strain ATCC 29082 / PCC 7421) TaxID=251221 RepID=Q7NP38_GLOVI|nr:sigma-70 family RNA polymerase sigma factor [Gloeobacter violaceus]BAC88161.1 glr0220 [Gloeobacter violaceus PCC 7421]
MQPRTQIVQVFCTYAMLDDSQWIGWRVDGELRRNMEAHLQRQPAGVQSVEQWCLFWFERWRGGEDRFARAHLIAFLYEPAYWSARFVRAGFHRQLTLTDLCQTAVANVDLVLQGFNPARGSDLKRFATRVFRNILYKALREFHEAEVCTTWSLLRKYSLKRLEEALQRQGYDERQIKSFLLACRCYKDTYVPVPPAGTRHLQPPVEQDWQRMAGLYTVRREPQLHQPAAAGQFREWLELSAKALRQMLTPENFSIGVGSTDEQGDGIELLRDPDLNPLDAAGEREEEAYRQAFRLQLRSVLVGTLAVLETPLQRVLELYYGEQLNQQEIAEQLGIKQYTVSRWMNRAKKQLATALGQWAKQKLHDSLELDVVEGMNRLLEEWLQMHFQPSDEGE